MIVKKLIYAQKCGKCDMVIKTAFIVNNMGYCFDCASEKSGWIQILKSDSKIQTEVIQS